MATDWANLDWQPGYGLGGPTGREAEGGDTRTRFDNAGRIPLSNENMAVLRRLGYTGNLTSNAREAYGYTPDQEYVGPDQVWSPEAIDWMNGQGMTVGAGYVPGSSPGGRAEYNAWLDKDGKYISGQSDPNYHVTDTFMDNVVPFLLMAGPIASATGVAGAGAGLSAGMSGIAADGVSMGSAGLGGSAAAAGGTLAAAAPTLAATEGGVTAIAPETIGTVTPGVSASELSALSSELPGQVATKTLGDYALQGATRGAIGGGLNSAAHGGDFGDILKGAAIGGTIGAATGTIGSGAGQFNVGESLGSSGAMSNALNGVGRGIIGGAMSSAITGKDFNPTSVLAGGAGAYASGLGLGQDMGLQGDWAKGFDSALGAGVSTAIKGGDVTGALVNSAGGSALNSAANWVTSPSDQHFLSDTTPTVTPLQHEDLSLPASTPIDYSSFTLPGDQHMADEDSNDDDTEYDPSDLDETTQNLFQQNQQQNQAALDQGAQDISDQVGNPTFTQGGLDSFLNFGSVVDQASNLGLGGSLMNAINGLGSWANNNKTLAAMLAGGLSSYANAERQDKLYQRALDEQHSQQQHYRDSVTGLRSPNLGIIGTHALRRTDGTQVFGTGANAGKLNVGG